VVLVSLRLHSVGAKYHYYTAQNVSSSLHTFTDGGATPAGIVSRASKSVIQGVHNVQGLVQIGKAREEGPLAQRYLSISPTRG
jgi:hypothetical protein